MALQTFTAGQILTAAQVTALQANDYNQTVSNKVASYVLAAADRGTRVVMNLGTATTITVNSGLFTAGDTLYIQNIGAGVCTITAGTATVTSSGSLALAQWQGGTLYFTSASAAIFYAAGVSSTATLAAIFNETQAQNTQGGASVASVFTKRTLNTTVSNNIGASIAASVITLTPGTYRVSAMAPFYNVTGVIIRLRNTTDATTTIAGVNSYVAGTSNAGCTAQLDGIFTITANKNFEIQYWANTATATNGLGVALNAAGISEIYTQVTIRKLA
jgi:hypothetical protein